MNKIEIDEDDVWLILYALKEITSEDGIKTFLKYHPHADLKGFENHVEKMVNKIIGEDK